MDIKIEQLVSKLLEIAKDPRYKPKYGECNILQRIKRIQNEDMNSNIIAYFLDPKEKHYHSEYLQLFLDQLPKGSKPILDQEELKNIQVTREVTTNEKRRIDILIESNKWVIIIESKIYAREQANQLDDYFKSIKTQYPNKEVYLYFLTLGVRDTCTLSDNKNELGEKYQNITWETHILSWIKSLEYKNTEPILGSSIIQYKDSLEILTNQKIEDIQMQMELLRELIENSELENTSLEQIKNLKEAMVNYCLLFPIIKVYNVFKADETCKFFTSTWNKEKEGTEKIENLTTISKESLALTNGNCTGVEIILKDPISIYFYIFLPLKEDWQYYVTIPVLEDNKNIEAKLTEIFGKTTWRSPDHQSVHSWEGWQEKFDTDNTIHKIEVLIKYLKSL